MTSNHLVKEKVEVSRDMHAGKTYCPENQTNLFARKTQQISQNLS